MFMITVSTSKGLEYFGLEKTKRNFKNEKF